MTKSLVLFTPKTIIVLVAVFCSLINTAWAESPASLLRGINGKPITTAEQWQRHRPALLDLATDFVYGHMPPKPTDVEFKTLSTRTVLNGKATETLAVMVLRRGKQTVPVRIGLIRPATTQSVGVIIKNDRWLFDLSSIPPGNIRDLYQRNHRDKIFHEVLPQTIERGYAICKFIRIDLAADAANSRETGVLAMYPDYDWGALAAWAWGYQPIIDYLIDNHAIDPARIIATGHSRGGKTALAAAIYDERISISAPSASGSGGTGSWQFFTPGGSRQTPAHFVKKRGYWFSSRLKELAKTDAPPIDGHTLRALVAPRGIINTQGISDSLSNPRGTRMMFDASEPVFELLGAGGRTATHWRPGVHGQTVEDWKAILDYADAFFGKKPLPKRMNNWPQGTTQ